MLLIEEYDLVISIVEKRWSRKVFKADKVHVWRADSLVILTIARLIGIPTVLMIRNSTPPPHHRIRYWLLRLSVLLAKEVQSNSIAGLDNIKAQKKGKVIRND